MDFIRPNSGSVEVFGQPTNVVSLHSRIGYLPETANFPTSLTILDLIRFTGKTCDMTSVEINKRSELLLKKLGLWEARKKRLSGYSKGMQQRANFVLALLNDPELLILDEPMSGLDPLGRGQIIELIQSLKREGKTILFCSHILSDVDRLVDKLLILHKGEVLFDGFPLDFVNQEGCNEIESSFLKLLSRQ